MSLTFNAFPLSDELLTVLSELGYMTPTGIQAQALPAMLEGRDLIAQSETGSGKTAAFGLTLLHRLDLEARGPSALVLCPTRELAAQIAREIRTLGRRLPGLQIRTISGGEQVRTQADALKRGVHIVVGTPGRVMDHMRRGHLDLSSIKIFVLDEADRMLEMGFQTDIEAIMLETPSQRQTLLFSATFPQSMEQISAAHQCNAVRVTVASDSAGTPPIRQVALMTEPEKRMAALFWVLNEYDYESALLFCNQKATVAEIEKQLHLKGASVDCLHGDLEQHQRDRVIALFRNRSIRILVATDVAARGIDVPDLDLVLNYELPAQSEVYAHRIGRTGRAGKTGIAVSLVSPSEADKLSALRKTCGELSEETWSKTSENKQLGRPPLMQTIQIWGGRKDKVRPGDVLGALTGEAGGLPANEVGKIEIHDRFSFVAVSLAHSQSAARSLSNGHIKGRRFRAAIVG